MAFDSFKTTKFPSNTYYNSGLLGAWLNQHYGTDIGGAGYKNLLEALQGRGRVDPRLLASAQAQNARSTQIQQDAARAGAARSGYSNSGLAAALQAAIGSAGANRSANLNYQDIADSYQRNQENLGLFNQLYIQPSLGYGSLGTQWGLGQQEQLNKQKAGVLGFVGSLLGGAGKAFGFGG